MSLTFFLDCILYVLKSEKQFKLKMPFYFLTLTLAIANQGVKYS